MANRPLSILISFLVNFIRPIPFVTFIAVLQPFTRIVIGTGIGINAGAFAIGVAASFAIGRIVEQHLVSVSPGVIEAARSMGAGPWRILLTVAMPEALGPLILGYTFIVVALIDMTAMAGLVGGGDSRRLRPGLRLPAVRAGRACGRPSSSSSCSSISCRPSAPGSPGGSCGADRVAPFCREVDSWSGRGSAAITSMCISPMSILRT